LSQQNQPSNLQQIIQNQKNNYIAYRSSQAAQEYDGLVGPYIQIILSQDKKIKELTDKLPKKERVKIIKGKK